MLEQYSFVVKPFYQQNNSGLAEWLLCPSTRSTCSESAPLAA